MKNQVLWAITAMATMFLVNGCQKPSVDSPTLKLGETEFIVTADGGSVSVPFELTNASDGAVVSVKPSAEYDWVAVTSVGETAIELTVAKNETTSQRNAEFTVSYPGASADAKFSVMQAAGEPAPVYDYDWAMANFSATWYGDQFGLNGEHNYYTWLSDLPFIDGYTQAGGTYYLFDIYGPAPSDESTPMIPAGTYTLGEYGATAEWTFSPDYSKAVRYNEAGLEWTVSYQEGTLVVSYEGTTLTMDVVLTDTEGKSHHLTYTGEGVCASDVSEDVPDEPVDPGFGDDLSFTPTFANASYYDGDGTLMEVMLNFTDMSFDSEGYLLPPGTYLAVDAIMPYDEDGKIAAGTYEVVDGSAAAAPYTVYPGEDFYGMLYFGTYAQNAVSDSEVYTSLITGGTMEIEGSDGYYTITCDFVGSDGYKISCSWSGNMAVEGMPGPISTLEGDYTLNLEGTVGEAVCYGDFYGTGGNNWMLQILPTSPTEGVDGFLADFVTESGDIADGIPSGTFTVSDNPGPGEFYPGYMSGTSLGGTMYVGGFDADGYVYEYAPAMSGEMSITNNGDGTYYLSFDFIDDKGNAWDGEWTGTIDLSMAQTASVSSVNANSVRPVRTVLESNIVSDVKTVEDKAAFVKDNSMKINFNSPVLNSRSSLRKVVR